MSKDRSRQCPRSHLFTIRMWKEEIATGQSEWRGKVQLVTSGEVRSFPEWSALVPLLLTMLSDVLPEDHLL